MEPPARSRSGRPISFFLGGPDIDGDDWLTARGSGTEGRVVAQAQILTEPNEGGSAHLRAGFPLLRDRVLRAPPRRAGTRSFNCGGSFKFCRNTRRSSGSSPAQSTLST